MLRYLYTLVMCLATPWILLRLRLQGMRHKTSTTRVLERFGYLTHRRVTAVVCGFMLHPSVRSM